MAGFSEEDFMTSIIEYGDHAFFYDPNPAAQDVYSDDDVALVRLTSGSVFWEMYDTSAQQARNGKDIQGFEWKKHDWTRELYREYRLQQYNNFVALAHSHEHLEKECKHVEKGYSFYDFQLNTRFVTSTIAHFQLRNLLWATSKHDVYLMQKYFVVHYSSLLKRGNEVLNVSKPITPTLNYPGCSAHSLPRANISSMTVKDNLMVAGGFEGELICKYVDKPGVAYCTRIGTNEYDITNAVEIFHNPSGSIMVMTANNDGQVRMFDAVNFECLSNFMFPWSVNNISISDDGNLLAVVGDSTDCLIADAQSGKVLSTLMGHLDYSFSSAWHPDGRILATGNQDKTCRLWDIRNLSESLAVIQGRIGAIRSIKFTSDGRFMAMAEAADFVHVLDTKSDFSTAQEIDFFGEIGGISFSPDSEALFVAISDTRHGSLMEFKRRRYNHYLDSIF